MQVSTSRSGVHESFMKTDGSQKAHGKIFYLRAHAHDLIISPRA